MLRNLLYGAILQQMKGDRKYSREIDVISPTSVRPSAVTLGEGLAVLAARPGPLEDSATFDRTAGGAEANVATVLAQLDIDAGWISRVGNDGFGRYLVRHLSGRGIDVAAVVVDPARPTAVYVKERGSGSAAAADLAEGESRMLYFRTDPPRARCRRQTSGLRRPSDCSTSRRSRTSPGSPPRCPNRRLGWPMSWFRCRAAAGWSASI